MNNNVKNALIKIAFENPELRSDLLPLINKFAATINVKPYNTALEKVIKTCTAESKKLHTQFVKWSNMPNPPAYEVILEGVKKICGEKAPLVTFLKDHVGEANVSLTIDQKSMIIESIKMELEEYFKITPHIKD